MNFPPIPTGPVTIAVNGYIIDKVLEDFRQKYLPAFEIEITSGYRSPTDNEAVDGAEYSAHLYNLARDFVLKDKTGNYLTAERHKQIYEQFVKPHWENYSYYHPPKTGITGWIHVNLDRDITKKTKYAEFAVTSGTVFLAAKKLFNILTKGGKS